MANITLSTPPRFLDNPAGLVFRRWLQPRSEDRDVAFRERTLRLVISIALVLISVTLFSSLVVFRDPWTLNSYPTVYTLMLLVAIASGAMVSQGRTVLSGVFMVVVWMLAAIGVAFIGVGYASTQAISILLFTVVVASVVLPRAAIFPVTFVCVVLSGVMTLLAYSQASVVDTSAVGVVGGIGTNAVLFFAVALFLRERVRESDDRLAAMRASIAEAEAAREEADRANRAKSQFLANMSHELRTPMNAVIGYTEIMLSGMAGTFASSQMDLLGNIQHNARRLLALINDVLDLAKIEAGRMQVVAAMASPREIIEGVVIGMNSLAEKNGIYLRVHFAEETPEAVLTDIGKVQQIVTNLVGNAIKFTERGGVSVEVSSADNVSDWQIKVRDTGIGMPSDAKNYIFEKFRQVDGTEARAYQGSGLGLAIVKSLVDTLEGSVDVETAMGKGTTFVITLPRQYVEKSEVS